MKSSEFRIAVAQSSSVKGDIAENIRRHSSFVVRAAHHSVNLVVFPELSLTGYEPSVAAETAIDSHDELLHPLQQLSDRLDVAIIAGCPVRSHEARPYLGAFIVRPHVRIDSYRKRFLHGDEVLHFVESNDVVVCACHGKMVGIAICADITNPTHAQDAIEQNATVYAAGVAMTPNGIAAAESNMADYARKHSFLTAMANYATDTGGYPMAGKSAIWNEHGNIVAQADKTGECLVIAEETSEGWSGHKIEL